MENGFIELRNYLDTGNTLLEEEWKAFANIWKLYPAERKEIITYKDEKKSIYILF